MNRIVVLKYGESIYNENYIFAGGNPDTMLPISFVIYLIQDGERNILVDAGCNDGAGFEMSCFCKPTEVLGEYGLKPEDITDVILTHHHHDHVESVGDFKNAVIHIQKEEYAPTKKFIPEPPVILRLANNLFETTMEMIIYPFCFMTPSFC